MTQFKRQKKTNSNVTDNKTIKNRIIIIIKKYQKELNFKIFFFFFFPVNVIRQRLLLFSKYMSTLWHFLTITLYCKVIWFLHYLHSFGSSGFWRQDTMAKARQEVMDDWQISLNASWLLLKSCNADMCHACIKICFQKAWTRISLYSFRMKISSLHIYL